jgi:uncharacterized RmlC-like cupin family protein
LVSRPGNSRVSRGVYETRAISEATMTIFDTSAPPTSAAPPAGVVAVRPPDPTATRQGLPAFVGVGEQTTGATGICMNLVEISPGAAAEPHAHVGFETAIYLLEGEVETRYGERLQHRLVSTAGDFVFIAAGVPHQPRNLSATSPVGAVVARNTAAEQESVALYEGPGSDG